MALTDDTFDPERDLVLERWVDVPPQLVWRAWTTPELLKKWFAPRPWTTTHAEVDARPGGIFLAEMRSPEGESSAGGPGCVLEAVENRRLAWTDALGPGFRPTGEGFFTCVLTLTPEGDGCRYRAVAMHGDPEQKTQHEDMGFLEGWGTCLDQLVEVVKAI